MKEETASSSEVEFETSEKETVYQEHIKSNWQTLSSG